MTNVWLILALLSPSVTGWFLLGAAAGRDVRGGWGVGVRLIAGTGIGWAVAAGVYFLWRTAKVDPGIGYRIVDCLVVPGVMAVICAVRRRPQAAPSSSDGYGLWPAWTITLVVLTLLVCAVAVAGAVKMALAEPVGSWDANAIWNLKARFMYRGGGGEWTRMFDKEIWFSHPDYPLMLPSSVARLWTYVGQETPAVPIGIGIGFTILTMALLFAGVGWVCGVVPACVAVMLLAGNEVFLWYGGAQVADVPLSFFVLAAVVFLTSAWRRHEGGETPPLRVVGVAGACAGLGAFVKNEGLAICVMLVVACAVAAIVFRRWKIIVALLVGMTMGLALVATQKLLFTGETYLTADQPSPTAAVEKVLDPERHRTILTFLARWYFGLREWYSPAEGWRLNQWPVSMPNEPAFLLLLALPLVFGINIPRNRRPPALAVGVLLVLVVLIYYAVLLVMPYDLSVLVQSLPRYFLHIVPAAIFWVCYVVRWERDSMVAAEATTPAKRVE